MTSAARPAPLAGLRVFRPEEPGRTRLPTRGQRWATFFLVAFLLIFPKGGVKLAGVPVTWGYVALGLIFLWFPIALWRARPERLLRIRLVILAALLPFQVIVWLALMVNGSGSTGFTISLLVTFFFIPMMFLLIIGIRLDSIHLGSLFGLIRRGVFFVAAYGIFLFSYKLVTGEFIEIPYLTVNAGDVGELETGKYIDRGGIFKLISTYNNGNLYGISILILLPLYAWLERRGWRVAVVKLSLLLTLSRTVWVGLIFYEIVHRFYVKRISARTVGVALAGVVLVMLGIWSALTLMGRSASFLFDRNLGGRAHQLSALESARALPEVPFYMIGEMVYLSILQTFGILGLVAFVIGMSAPLAAHVLRVLPGSATPYKRSLAAGLLTYLFVAMADGGILLIPVMAFYWFVASLLLSDNRSFAEWDSFQSATR